MKKGVKKQLITRIIMIFLFLVGSLTALYPFYSDAINGFIDQRMIERYQKKAKEQELTAMQQANEEIAKKGTAPNADPFEEASQEKSASQQYIEKHLIGTLTIPSIQAVMPVFDTTNDRLLERGATVLQGTSYPTGGENTHSAISAHRGLPQRQLFTDLPDVKLKDIFVLEILGEKLAYEVDQIKVVEPNVTEDLKLVSGEDLVTLITCTPYMINSHRLLVRGHRVPYTEEMAATVKKTNESRLLQQMLIMLGIVLLLGVLGYLFYRVCQNYRLRKKTIDVVFYLEDAQSVPLKNQQVVLFDRKGKQTLLRNDVPYAVNSDENGKVIFKNLPGNLYTVKLKGEKMNGIRFQIGLTKPKQTILQFVFPKGVGIRKVGERETTTVLQIEK